MINFTLYIERNYKGSATRHREALGLSMKRLMKVVVAKQLVDELRVYPQFRLT